MDTIQRYFVSTVNHKVVITVIGVFISRDTAICSPKSYFSKKFKNDGVTKVLDEFNEITIKSIYRVN